MKIIDNQKNSDDGLEHLDMGDIFKYHHDHADDFKFHVGSGFFFLNGFGEIYDKIDVTKFKQGDDSYLEKWGTKAPFLILMGKKTNLMTKNALLDEESMINHALNSNDENYLYFLESLIKKEIIKIKVFQESMFHVKIYFFYNGNEIRDIYTGSANFTSAGFSKNVELTAPILSTHENKEAHKLWFKRLWDRSTDDLNVLEIIENFKKSNFIYYSPKRFFEAFIKILGKEYLFYDSTLSNNTLLVKFQSFDFYQVMNALEKYNGCILASSVGLGKSYVALETIRYFEDRNMEALLIGPSNLVKGKESTWSEYLSKYNLNVETIGFGDLQQSGFIADNYKDYDLVVIDEAHNLRNKSTIKRENIEKIIYNSPNAKYLLLTATPINVKISDLTSLIDLFYNINAYNWADTGIKEIYDKFKIKVNKLERFSGSELKQEEFFRDIQKLQSKIEKELIVKSTRNVIKKYFQEDLIILSGTSEIHNPKVNKEDFNYPKRIRFIFKSLPNFLEKLNYEHAKFSKKENSYEYSEDLNLINLYKWVLYKRAESSLFAFYESLKRLKIKIKIYIHCLTNSEESSINSFDKEFKSRLEAAKIVFNGADENLKENILGNLKEDVNNVNFVIEQLNILKKDIYFDDDEKIQKLISLIKNNNQKKFLIFTEYFDTLYYIYKNLEKEDIKVGFVSGKDLDGNPMKPSKKEKIVLDFKNNKFNSLVSTDVLSEGFNIPEADVVINFDLPYNPVRIIQRIGRATRIDVPKQIEIINFQPDESIDFEIKLIEKLNLRISNIINMIGIDYSIWNNTEEELKKRKKIDKVNKLEILKELKNQISEKNPEDIYHFSESNESKTDLLLKESIIKYSLVEDSIPKNKPTKPIYTNLIGRKSYIFGIYDINNNHFEHNQAEEKIIEPIKTKNVYNDEILINEFLPEIKKQYKLLSWNRGSSGLENREDIRLLNKIEEIRSKCDYLKDTMINLKSTRLYFTPKISSLINDEVYPFLVENNFACLANLNHVKQWKKRIDSIISDSQTHFDIVLDDKSANNKVVAFIQYDVEEE